ncbi:MAG: hypothetical protein ACM3Q1_13190 [Bacteroidales bacterium]
MALRGLKLAGWLVILGGFLVSAVRVVTALKDQAFDQVASAGLPAVYCLVGGALVLMVTHTVQNTATIRALLKDFCPTQPASVIGLALLLGGASWIVYVYWSLNDPSVRAWAIIPASLGGLAALVGLILMLVAGVRRPRGSR